MKPVSMDNILLKIGVDFTLKKIDWDKKTVIKMQLDDTAGQERFQSMTRVYYKDAVGCLMVFDVARPGSLEAVLKWKNDLDSKITLVDGTKLSCVLLANKVSNDLDPFSVTLTFFP